MNWRTLGAASLLTAIAALSAPTYADTRGEQAALEQEITTLNQQIAAKQQQIATMRNRPSPEQADVAAAQKVLNDARAELDANPGPDSEGKVRNAEFKLKLAEIRYDRAHGEVEAMDDDIARMKQQIADKQRQISELTQQSAERASAQQQKAAAERAQRNQAAEELARSRREAAAAQQEIERLKAALAAKETAEAKAAPAPEPSPTPAPAQPAKTEPVKSANSIVRLTSQQQVLAELQAMAERAAQDGGGRSYSRMLYLKAPGAAASNKNRIGLRSLGNHQYRGAADVKAGDYEAVIGFNSWPVTFSAADAGDNVFLLDSTNDKEPRLLIYSSHLESGH